MLWKVARAAAERIPAAPARRYLQAIVVASLGVALSLLTWVRALEERQYGVSNLLGSLADETTGSIEVELDREVNALRRLATFWQLHGLLPEGPWQFDTRATLDHFPGIQWIAWVPADTSKMRLAVRDTTVRVDPEALRQARSPSATAAPLTQDLWSDAYQLRVFLPVGSPSESVGVLFAGMRVDSLWLQEREPANHGLSIMLSSEKGDSVILRRAPDSSVPRWMQVRRTFTSPAGTIIRADLSPWPEYVAQVTTPWPHYFLVTGLFLSISIGVLLFQYLRMQDYLTVLAGTNEDLDAKLAELSKRDREMSELNLALEQRVRTRTAALSEAVREVEAFSHSVSHDLRSPIGAILNFVAVLQEDYGSSLDPEGRRLLDRIRAAGERGNLLLNGLLEFATSGANPSSPRMLDMRLAADAAFAEASAGERDGGEVKLSVGELPPAWADGNQVHRVLVNLIGNGLKYSRGRPVREMSVGATANGREVTYWVRDNGNGFDPARATEVFEPFRRLHGSDVEGTGLGLAIVAKVVRRQGGRVWAESDGRTGATFYFTLPASKREKEDEAAGPARG